MRQTWTDQIQDIATMDRSAYRDMVWDVIELNMQLAGFTYRQTDVMRCILSGMANKDIANHLGVTAPMVDRDIRDIFTKLDVRDRLQAVLWLVELEGRNG